MKATSPDFEISIQGRTHITVQDGRLDVRGSDFGTDMASITRLINILSGIVESAVTAQTPPATSSNVHYMKRLTRQR